MAAVKAQQHASGKRQRGEAGEKQGMPAGRWVDEGEGVLHELTAQAANSQIKRHEREHEFKRSEQQREEASGGASSGILGSHLPLSESLLLSPSWLTE